MILGRAPSGDDSDDADVLGRAPSGDDSDDADDNILADPIKSRPCELAAKMPLWEMTSKLKSLRRPAVGNFHLWREGKGTAENKACSMQGRGLCTSSS